MYYRDGTTWVESRVSSLQPNYSFGSSGNGPTYNLEILDTGDYRYSVVPDAMEKKAVFEKKGSKESTFAGRLPETDKGSWAASVKSAAQGAPALDCLEHILRVEMYNATEHILHTLSMLDGLCTTITASQSMTVSRDGSGADLIFLVVSLVPLHRRLTQSLLDA